MTTTVKAAGAAQFLSLVPHLLGFQPSDSLVVVPFDGGRSLGAMRFDLPAAAENMPDNAPDDTVDRVASTVLGMVCRISDATALAAIVYTADRFDTTHAMPHGDLLRAITQRADACGLHVTDMLCVAGDAWGSLLEADCPPLGHPLAEIDAIPDAATGPIPQGDQTAGASLPPVDPSTKEAIGHAVAALETVFRVLAGASDDDTDAARTSRTSPDGDGSARDYGADDGQIRIDPQAIAAAYSMDDVPGLYEEALGWDLDDLGAYDVALLGWCLARPSMRDVALVQWSGAFDDGDEALDAQLKWESGEEYPPHLAMRMWGDGPQPDPERLSAALQVTRRIAASVPRRMQPGPLSMCAWLSWALGRSTHADVYAQQACEIEPEHGLSEIVRSFVGAGHLPDWAFIRGRERR